MSSRQLIIRLFGVGRKEEKEKEVCVIMEACNVLSFTHYAVECSLQHTFITIVWHLAIKVMFFLCRGPVRRLENICFETPAHAVCTCARVFRCGHVIINDCTLIMELDKIHS